MGSLTSRLQQLQQWFINSEPQTKEQTSTPSSDDDLPNSDDNGATEHPQALDPEPPTDNETSTPSSDEDVPENVESCEFEPFSPENSTLYQVLRQLMSAQPQTNEQTSTPSPDEDLPENFDGGATEMRLWMRLLDQLLRQNMDPPPRTNELTSTPSSDDEDLPENVDSGATQQTQSTNPEQRNNNRGTSTPSSDEEDFLRNLESFEHFLKKISEENWMLHQLLRQSTLPQSRTNGPTWPPPPGHLIQNVDGATTQIFPHQFFTNPQQQPTNGQATLQSFSSEDLLKIFIELTLQEKQKGTLDQWRAKLDRLATETNNENDREKKRSDQQLKMRKKRISKSNLSALEKERECEQLTGEVEQSLAEALNQISERMAARCVALQSETLHKLQKIEIAVYDDMINDGFPKDRHVYFEAEVMKHFNNRVPIHLISLFPKVDKSTVGKGFQCVICEPVGNSPIDANAVTCNAACESRDAAPSNEEGAPRQTSAVSGVKPPWTLGDDGKAVVSKELESGSVTTLPCFHTFHTACIGHWLESASNCPSCRSDVGALLQKGCHDADGIYFSESLGANLPKMKTPNLYAE